MPAGRKAKPISEIVIKLTSNDADLAAFCEYYKSNCGRKAGEKKLRGEGVLDKDIDGDYTKYIKDQLLPMQTLQLVQLAPMAQTHQMFKLPVPGHMVCR